MRRAFSSSVYVVCDDTVLLIKHKRLDLWLPIGGEIERVDRLNDSFDNGANVETPLEAARRELVEETGLGESDVTFPPLSSVDGEPPGFLGYEEHAAGEKGLHMNFCFFAISTTSEIRGDGSFSEHAWVPMANICLPIPKNVRQMIYRAQLALLRYRLGVCVAAG